MMDKQGQARLAERVRRHYLPPSDLPVFCTLCKVSTTTGLCPVCLRSLEEITNWPRLDEEHRRTVWGRVLMRLDDARQYEQAARRRGLSRRVSAPVEPPPVEEVLTLADSGVPPLAQDGHASPLEPADAEATPGSDVADTSAAVRAQTDAAAAQALVEDLLSAAPSFPPAPGEPDVASAAPASVPETPPSAAVAAPLAPAPAMNASTPVLPESPDAQPETLMHAGVPVDVAAARARQVRLAMAQVVQASMESARREQARPSPGPEEIRLQPLI